MGLVLFQEFLCSLFGENVCKSQDAKAHVFAIKSIGFIKAWNEANMRVYEYYIERRIILSLRWYMCIINFEKWKSLSFLEWNMIYNKLSHLKILSIFIYIFVACYNIWIRTCIPLFYTIEYMFNSILNYGTPITRHFDISQAFPALKKEF